MSGASASITSASSTAPPCCRLALVLSLAVQIAEPELPCWVRARFQSIVTSPVTTTFLRAGRVASMILILSRSTMFYSDIYEVLHSSVQKQPCRLLSAQMNVVRDQSHVREA